MILRGEIVRNKAIQNVSVCVEHFIDTDASKDKITGQYLKN